MRYTERYESDITECVTDLNYQSKPIIFESVLTTFNANVIFRDS
jgi:hypothetical protein